MKEVAIDTEYIKLDQFLKLIGIVGTGGSAKIIINEGNVKVNGEVCTIRGKKLRKDDRIEIDEYSFKII